MTEARTQSANDRLKASYDKVLAASLIRVAVLHFLVFQASPVLAEVAVEASRSRTIVVYDYFYDEPLGCGFPLPGFVLPTDTLPDRAGDSVRLERVRGEGPTYRLAAIFEEGDSR